MKFKLEIFLYFWMNTQTIFTLSDNEFPHCTESTKFLDLLNATSNFETLKSHLTLSGRTTFSPKNHQLEVESNYNISRSTTPECPSLQYASEFSQMELVKSLTAPCRYDSLKRPPTPDKIVIINARAFLYSITESPIGNQLSMQLKLEFRYVDSRLAFEKYAPKRTEPIQGDSKIQQMIWFPQLYLTNARDTNLLSTFRHDVLTSIAPDGTVVLTLSTQSGLICTTQLKKFPFNEQSCTLTIESWLNNSTELLLLWEDSTPIALSNHFYSIRYSLESFSHNISILKTQQDGMWYGSNPANYSSMSLSLILLHNSEYYIMDYFIPSMMLVAASWVSFWLRADQTPARSILGCQTMLSLITLSANQLKNASGFDKVFEAWFLGCGFFIFACLVEFAFSNTIWRRKRNVLVGSASSKDILKSTVVPRKIHRRSIYEGFERVDSISCLTETPVIMTSCLQFDGDCCENSNSLTKISAKRDDELNSRNEMKRKKSIFATMTPEEVSIWLDRKARFVFPLAFLIFNLFFWLFALTL